MQVGLNLIYPVKGGLGLQFYSFTTLPVAFVKLFLLVRENTNCTALTLLPARIPSDPSPDRNIDKL